MTLRDHKTGQWFLMRARRRPYVAATGLLLIALAVVVAFRPAEDWHRTYLKAARFLVEGRDIYQLEETGFTYPPAAALPAVPFAYLAPWAGRLGYLIVTLPAIPLFFWTAWWAAGGRRDPTMRIRGSRPVRANSSTAVGSSGAGHTVTDQDSVIPETDWREHAVLWLGMLVSFRFFTDVVEHQQNDFLIAALVTAAAVLSVRGRMNWAAVCCGIGAAIKATPLLWMVYFLVKRRWSAAIIVPVVAVGLNLSVDLISHPPAGGLWLTRWVEGTLQPIITGEQPPGVWATAPVLNQSMAGTLNRLMMFQWPQTQDQYFTTLPAKSDLPYHPRLIRLLTILVFVLGMLPMVVKNWPARRWRKKDRHSADRSVPSQHRMSTQDSANCAPAEGLEAAIIIMLMVLLSPASSKPHFLVMLLPAYCLARSSLYEGRWVAVVCLAIAVVLSLASNRSLVGEPVGEPLQWAGCITWCALILMIGCAVTLLRQGRRVAISGGPSA